MRSNLSTFSQGITLEESFCHNIFVTFSYYQVGFFVVKIFSFNGFLVFNQRAICLSFTATASFCEPFLNIKEIRNFSISESKVFWRPPNANNLASPVVPAILIYQSALFSLCKFSHVFGEYSGALIPLSQPSPGFRIQIYLLVSSSSF